MSAPGDVRLVRPDRPAPAGATASLHRIVWRWHFYAGVLVAPVLVVVAVTGGLYVFKAELERLLYPSVLTVPPGPVRVPLEAQVAAAKASVPDGYRAGSVGVWPDPTMPTEVFFQAKDRPFKLVYVDPYTGAVTGELAGDGLFRTVLKLHRTLFLGPAGRVVVELTTGWTVVLLVTGLYLWWPRKRTAAGLLYPRLRAKPYAVLRDLHAVAGFYLLPVSATAALTGLLYTQVWGGGYFLAAERTGASAGRTPPKSVSPPEARPLPLDAAFAAARSHYPDAGSLSLSLPSRPDAALVVFAGGATGPVTHGVLALDRSTGEVLANTPEHDQPAMRRWTGWNYSLHVGSVLGRPTKVLWLVACGVLTALPLTGLWMWWARRPAGRTGFPRRPDVRVPRRVLGAAALLGVLLPLVGASMLAVLAGEWVVARTRRRRATPRIPVPA